MNDVIVSDYADCDTIVQIHSIGLDTQPQQAPRYRYFVSRDGDKPK